MHAKNQSATSDDRNYGGYIITPFRCAGTKKCLMVNRGFLPDSELSKDKRDPRTLDTSEQTITGIFRIKGDKANHTSHYIYNSDESARFNNKHHETMAKFFVEKSEDYDEVLYPFVIDELVDSPSKDYDLVGQPIGGQTRMDIPNNHLGYGVLWNESL